MLATGCLRLVRQSFTAHAPPGAEIDESAVDVNGFAAYGARPIMGLCQGCKPGAQLLGNGSAIIFFHRRLLKKVGEVLAGLLRGLSCSPGPPPILHHIMA